MKNNQHVKVSIIMTTFNTQDYIQRSIRSVINQSYQNWELIVVNDASTDRTDDVIKSFLPHKKIHLYKNAKNKGIPKSLNKGLAGASGDLIAILDADDEWTDQDKLAKQVQFMDLHYDYGLVGTFAKAVNEKGQLLFDIRYPVTDTGIRKQIMLHNCFLHSTIMYRKELLKIIEDYDNSSIAQDYDLCLKLGSVAKMANLPIFTTNYTIHSEGTSQRKYYQQTSDAIKVLRKYKTVYPGYWFSMLMWNLRLSYPKWLRYLIFKISDKL